MNFKVLKVDRKYFEKGKTLKVCQTLRVE